MSRRTMMNRIVLGGALAVLGVSAEAAAQPSDRVVQEVSRAIDTVRDELRRQYEFREIEPLREPMRSYLRANGKFPDYVEVGMDVWQRVYDWHVRFQQPIVLGRTPEGRYTILLQFTNVVMRTDVSSGYIGIPYDTR